MKADASLGFHARARRWRKRCSSKRGSRDVVRSLGVYRVDLRFNFDLYDKAGPSPQPRAGNGRALPQGALFCYLWIAMSTCLVLRAAVSLSRWQWTRCGGGAVMGQMTKLDPRDSRA